MSASSAPTVNVRVIVALIVGDTVIVAALGNGNDTVDLIDIVSDHAHAST